METYDDKYQCTLETLKSTLDKYGVAILPSILTEEECDIMLSEMWDFFEHISQNWDIPLNRNDTATWKEFYKLYPMHSMLIQHYNIGHSQAVWNARQNPKLIEPFCKIWNCNPTDLLVSFDGASFSMPPEIVKRGWFRNNWMHTDQSYTRNGFECIQSWVTPIDVDDGDATLAFYESSHKAHGIFRSTFNISNKDDWFQLKNEEHERFYSSLFPLKRIKCSKGSMVFWDSRLIHCGNEAMKCRNYPKQRCAIYLCYQPRNFITSSNLNKKKKAFENMRMTSHWPCKIKLFGKRPRTYSAEEYPTTIINRPILNELGMKLAGF